MFRMLPMIAILMLAGAAIAQINHPYNEVGIYTVEQPDGCETAQIDVPAMTPFTCYMVLTSPHRESLGRPVAMVGGVECRLGLPADVYLLSISYPPRSTGPCFGDPLEILFGAELPVADGQCVLLTMGLMAANDAPQFVSLLPAQDMPPSIPGQMSFSDYDDGFALEPMHPVSGSFDVPVFAINWDGELSFCETVPVRDASFGEVKAMFR